MSKRTFLIYGGLFLLLVTGQIGLLIHLHRRARPASIECNATIAGVPLQPEDARVYVHPAFQPEQLVAEGKLDETLEVPAGRYDVRVLYTRSQDQQSLWIEDIPLEQGQRTVREVQFESGEIRVDAMVGAAAAAAGQVVVYVLHPQDHDDIITTMGPGEPVVLASGIYDLRVVLLAESEEKDVVWLREVPVKVGLQTRREVVFRRGFLKVRVTNAGQDLPAEAVSIKVYRAGDRQEEVVDSSDAGPSLSLPIGRYDARVTFSGSSDKPSRWLRSLQIRENETLQQVVDFSSGTIVTEARIKNGKTVGDFEVYVHYYRAGDHQQPLAYTGAGQPVILESGRYDLRASFFRSLDQPDIWRRGLLVEAGKLVRRTLYFPSGKLLVRAYDSAGEELMGDNVFVHVYAAGQRSRPLFSARSGEMLVVTEGVYDIRAEDTRTPSREVWLNDVGLTAGALMEKSVWFNHRRESQAQDGP